MATLFDRFLCNYLVIVPESLDYPAIYAIPLLYSCIFSVL